MYIYIYIYAHTCIHARASAYPHTFVTGSALYAQSFGWVQSSSSAAAASSP